MRATAFRDIVGALRADQAWGSAQLMGGLHRVPASYYGLLDYGRTQNNGHPGDKCGWAAGAGFQLKNFLGMQGDTFGRAGELRSRRHELPDRCRRGALAGFSGGANGLGNSIYFRNVDRRRLTPAARAALPRPAAAIELTTGWTAGGAIEHHWNPQWKTSVYGGYNKYTYNDTAANYICNGSFTVGWARGTARLGSAVTPVLTRHVAARRRCRAAIRTCRTGRWAPARSGTRTRTSISVSTLRGTV